MAGNVFDSVNSNIFLREDLYNPEVSFWARDKFWGTKCVTPKAV